MEITKAGRSAFRLPNKGEKFKGKPVFNSNTLPIKKLKQVELISKLFFLPTWLRSYRMFFLVNIIVRVGTASCFNRGY